MGGWGGECMLHRARSMRAHLRLKRPRRAATGLPRVQVCLKALVSMHGSEETSRIFRQSSVRNMHP
eukprot:6189010-Pleurochrysis_carterae.AAC.1